MSGRCIQEDTDRVQEVLYKERRLHPRRATTSSISWFQGKNLKHDIMLSGGVSNPDDTNLSYDVDYLLSKQGPIDGDDCPQVFDDTTSSMVPVHSISSTDRIVRYFARVKPAILLSMILLLQSLQHINALATTPYHHQHHRFPETSHGSRNNLLDSDGLISAIKFIDQVHEDRYANTNCPILSPAWKNYDENGPMLSPAPIDSLLYSESKPKNIFISYSKEDTPPSFQLPSIPSLPNSVDHFSSKKNSSKKGFGGTSNNGGFGSSPRKKKIRRKNNKWNADNIDSANKTPPPPKKDSPLMSNQHHYHPVPTLFDGNFCHVSKSPVFTTEECKAIVTEAEEEGTSDKWKSHEQYYKAMKITRRIDEMPYTRDFFGKACIERIFPLIQRMYPNATPQGKDGLRHFRIFSAKVLRYDSISGNDYLGIHNDGSLLTFLISLNDSSNYEGGGTFIEGLGEAIRYDAGHILCHPGIVRHGGGKVTSGVRYVLAAWIDIYGVKEYDRQLCEEADLMRMSGRLDESVQLGFEGGADDLGKVELGSISSISKMEKFYLYSLACGEMYSQRDHSFRQSHEDSNEMVPKLTSENTWLGLGQLWLDQGKSIQASEAFQNALDLNPNNVRGWISYGLALIKLKHTDDAIHAFTTAAGINIYEFDALSNLGLLLSMLGRHDEANDTFKKAASRVQIGKDGSIKADKRAAAELYNNWGVTLCDLGRYREAMVIFSKSVIVDPTFHDAANNLKAVKSSLL